MSNYRIKAEQMLEMIRLQDKMNCKAISPNWKDRCRFPEVSFLTAMLVETGEFCDHMAFKWWKHQEPNIPQAKLELVDIFHFLVSEVLSINYHNTMCGYLGESDSSGSNAGTVEAVSNLAQMRTLGQLSTGLNTVLSMMNKDGRDGMTHFREEMSMEEKKQSVIGALRKVSTCFDVFRESEDKDVEHLPAVFEEAAENFFLSCIMLEMSMEELYLLYIGKNALNHFRQDNDYKGGSYVKIWSVEDGEELEDNDFLYRFIDTLKKLDNLGDESAYDTIYDHLTSQYELAKKRAA